MDLLGRKAKVRIAELERLLLEAERDRKDLAIALRDLDQSIYNMAQQPSWERMQPTFAELCERANVRMVAESDRIKNILLPELNRTYNR